MNELVRDIVLGKIRSMLHDADAVKGLKHKGEKGFAREIVLRRIAQWVVPPIWRVGTGFVVNSSGKCSKQQDLVIYDPTAIPPILWSEDRGVFPLEGVRATIEVKSITRSDELRTWCNDVSATDLRIPMQVYFGYNAGISRKAIEAILTSKKVINASVCVLDRGYWFTRQVVPCELEACPEFESVTWQRCHRDTELEKRVSEVLDLVGILSNTFYKMAGQNANCFGPYVLGNRDYHLWITQTRKWVRFDSSRNLKT